MPTTKEVDIRGKSKHGGVKALVVFLDEKHEPVEETQAKFANVIEMDEEGRQVFRAYFALGKRKEPQTKSLPMHTKADAPAPAPTFQVTPAKRKQPKRPPVPEQPEPNKVPPSPFQEEEGQQPTQAQPVQQAAPEEQAKPAPAQQPPEAMPQKAPTPTQQQVPPAGQTQQAPAQQAPQKEAPKQKGPKLEDTLGAIQEMDRDGLSEDGALGLAVSIADHSDEDLQKLQEQLMRKVGTQGVQRAQHLAQQALQRAKLGPPTPGQNMANSATPRGWGSAPGMGKLPLEETKQRLQQTIFDVADILDMPPISEDVNNGLEEIGKFMNADLVVDVEDQLSKVDDFSDDEQAMKVALRNIRDDFRYAVQQAPEDQWERLSFYQAPVESFFVDAFNTLDEHFQERRKAGLSDPTQAQTSQQPTGQHSPIGQALANNIGRGHLFDNEKGEPENEQELVEYGERLTKVPFDLADMFDMPQVPEGVNEVLKKIVPHVWGSTLDQLEEEVDELDQAIGKGNNDEIEERLQEIESTIGEVINDIPEDKLSRQETGILHNFFTEVKNKAKEQLSNPTSAKRGNKPATSQPNPTQAQKGTQQNQPKTPKVPQSPFRNNTQANTGGGQQPKDQATQDRIQNTVDVVSGIADTWDMKAPDELLARIRESELNDYDTNDFQLIDDQLNIAFDNRDKLAALSAAYDLVPALIAAIGRGRYHTIEDDNLAENFRAELEQKIEEYLG